MDTIVFDIIETEFGYKVTCSLIDLFKLEFIKGLSNVPSVVLVSGVLYGIYNIYIANTIPKMVNNSTTMTNEFSRKRKRTSEIESVINDTESITSESETESEISETNFTKEDKEEYENKIKTLLNNLH